MIYIKAINIFFAVAGVLLFLWQLTAIIRDAIVFMQFKDFISANKAMEDLSKEDGNKVVTAIILGGITCTLWSLLVIY